MSEEDRARLRKLSISSSVRLGRPLGQCFKIRHLDEPLYLPKDLSPLIPSEASMQQMKTGSGRLKAHKIRSIASSLLFRKNFATHQVLQVVGV